MTVFHDGEFTNVSRGDAAVEALTEKSIPLSAWVVDGSPNSPIEEASNEEGLGTAEAASGQFGTVANYLATDDEKNETTSKTARAQIPIPANYIAGQAIKFRFRSGMKTTVASTSASLDLECYKSDRAGGAPGNDLCTTAAQSINSLTLANKDFSIDETGLKAGDVLDIRITISIVDSATGTPVFGVVTHAAIMCGVKL